MSDTLIIQSHRSPLPYPWLSHCVNSVRRWSTGNDCNYRFLNDELFDHVDAELLGKVANQRVIATDLARLRVLQAALREGIETVVWLDADFLIFDPDSFVLPETPYAVGREVWVQRDPQDKLKVYNKVHNAFLMVRQGNTFLEFYLETAERLLRRHRGGMPPQFIGPKLLTALHNVCQLPVMESAGMLSPLVIQDLLQGGGEALRVFRAKSSAPLAGANLCVSSCDAGELDNTQMERLIEALIERQNLFVESA